MKLTNNKLTTKNLALVVSLAPCYAILSFLYLFKMIGDAGRFITAATIIAPVIGLLLNPYISIVTIATGGLAAFFMGATGPYGPLSFLPHAATAFCASLLYNGKRTLCLISYSSLLLIFAFYPVIGPIWLWPSMIWMHIIGLILLFSPLPTKVVQGTANEFGWNFSIFAMIFVAVLYGHLAGSILYEVIYWPHVHPEIEFWKGLWQFLLFVYPIERMIIVLSATLIATGVMKAIKTQ